MDESEIAMGSDSPKPYISDLSRKRTLLRKPPSPPDKLVRQDRALSAKQIKHGQWLANRKKIQFPPELLASSNKWWGWINSKITEIDRQDAHAASKDFNLKVNYSDPLEIVGAIKYAQVADSSDKMRSAKRAILKGCHPYTVEDSFSLTPPELRALIKDVELNHLDFEIDWGSV